MPFNFTITFNKLTDYCIVKPYNTLLTEYLGDLSFDQWIDDINVYATCSTVSTFERNRFISLMPRACHFHRFDTTYMNIDNEKMRINITNINIPSMHFCILDEKNMYLDNSSIKHIVIKTDDDIMYNKNYHNIRIHHEIVTDKKMSETLLSIYFSVYGDGKIQFVPCLDYSGDAYIEISFCKSVINQKLCLMVRNYQELYQALIGQRGYQQHIIR